MSANVKKYKILVLTSLCTALALAVSRLIIIMNNIEVSSLENSDGLYYIEGTNAPTVFAVFCLAAALVYFVCSALLAGKVKFVYETDSTAVLFASALTGMMLVTLAFYYTYRMVLEKVKYDAGFIAIIVLTVISALYFLFLSSKSARVRFSRILPLLSMAPVVLTAARLLYDFVDRSLTVNASSYSYHLMGLAALMLFLCCEGRFTVGFRRKRIYTALGLITCMLLLVYCLPALYLALFWPLKFTDVTVYCVADLIITVYIYARLLSMPAHQETAEAVTAE